MFLYLLCYLPEGGHICMRHKVEGKYAHMKNPCDNLDIA